MREREINCYVTKFNKKCVRELLRRVGPQIKQIKIKLENNF